MATLEKAIALAATKHQGQRDIGGKPYILHPLHVMSLVDSINEKIVAVMHDLIEDTGVSLDDLAAMGFDHSIIFAIDCLTKRKREDRISAAHRAAANRLACAVKLADVTHNMDLSRIPNPTMNDYARHREYEKVKLILEDAKVGRWNGFAE